MDNLGILLRQYIKTETTYGKVILSYGRLMKGFRHGKGKDKWLPTVCARDIV